ncbi:putative ABC transporter permease [Thomasclavelia sp.]|uniref:putative ABC transporter permease n=1 Tax=Thomasclavelia sp. TaxID=3025757 RepID=UPI002636F19F|nr:putative ABC transporter permease [Thomasclavelia sp.]
MNLFLTLAFLFFIGATTGWAIEVLFRRFLSSANPERKWINPGFCTGPYLPLYGVGLCLLYLIASLEQYSFVKNPFWNKALLFLAMAVFMTVIEYIAGILILKSSKVRLWDYRNEFGNIQGIICPKFSII